MNPPFFSPDISNHSFSFDGTAKNSRGNRVISKISPGVDAVINHLENTLVLACLHDLLVYLRPPSAQLVKSAERDHRNRVFDRVVHHFGTFVLAGDRTDCWILRGDLRELDGHGWRSMGLGRVERDTPSFICKLGRKDQCVGDIFLEGKREGKDYLHGVI
ncbi:hypothetical protein Vadar_031809 [Vaccinium darrowii]|uniref:Uncharacterized protein n=1 Tax=Vaccinium darrowii TaxID=229202 RepID=A0ACB7YBD8_9ERIC|nr:hypothetical protein Vadar_031809 [Vaccinium darrowii]